jgi:hypothetical protein
VLSVVIPFDGFTETVITFINATLFFYCLAKAIGAAKKKKIADHRAWMVRATAVGLSVATMRVLNGILFPLHFVDDRTLFSISLILSSVFNLIIAQIFIINKRGPS